MEPAGRDLAETTPAARPDIAPAKAEIARPSAAWRAADTIAAAVKPSSPASSANNAARSSARGQSARARTGVAVAADNASASPINARGS